jgi:hypothetical protein
VIATASWASALGWAAIALAISALAGALIHAVAVRRLRRYGEARGLRRPTAAADSLRGLLEVWGGLIGVFIADPRSSLPEDWSIWLERAWIVVFIVVLNQLGVEIGPC